jgi:hypothetical protein
MEAVVNRRSRRFSMGATMNGGALAYKSSQKPVPLSTLEEAILVTAAAGISGHPLADLPYDSGNVPESGGGNVIASFNGRTVASADGVHGTALFVINDEGTFLLRRPQDLPQVEISDLGNMTHDRRLEEVYRRIRIQISDKRTEIPREVPHMFSFNKWSTNLPGTTYFVPASEMTAMYINLLLSAFDEEMAFFVVDERNGYAPAGIAKFGKSRGGKLNDDLKAQVPRVGTIQLVETITADFLMAEQSFMGHNLMLAEQAMGLGGWSHFATARPPSWFEALGFRMGSQALSQSVGTGLGRLLFMGIFGRIAAVTRLVNSFDVGLRRLTLNLLGQNVQIPIPLGFEHKGEMLLKPFCPPYYKSMEEAVLAFLDYKMSNIKSGKGDTAWKDTQAVEATIPKFSDQCIAATIAYAEYVFKRYGNFPCYYAPFRMTFGYQAHHLDLSFYDKFYKPGAYTSTQAQHMQHWH